MIFATITNINSWCQKSADNPEFYPDSISIHGVRRIGRSRTIQSISSGFKGPYICWAVLWICGLTIIFRIIVWLRCEHSETRAPKISRFTNWTTNTPMAILEFSIPWTFLDLQVISKQFNGDSGIFSSLNFSPLFHQWGGEYMSKRWIWTICWVFFLWILVQGTQAMLTQDKETKKVWTLQPKPSHTRGAECEEQLEEQHRQGAGVQPYPVIT